MKFTIFNKTTGDILRVVDCDPEFVMHQAGDGEGIWRGTLDGRKLKIDPETSRPVRREIPDEEILEEIRVIRDKKLLACDWTQLPDAPVDKEAWAVYRQQLRDLPDTIDIRSFEWPIPPQ